MLKSIIDKDIPGGEHVFSFDAGDLASGMYFYRFVSNERVKSGRLLLERDF